MTYGQHQFFFFFGIAHLKADLILPQKMYDIPMSKLHVLYTVVRYPALKLGRSFWTWNWTVFPDLLLISRLMDGPIAEFL